MADRQKLLLDDDMMQAWKKYVYEEAIADNNYDYRHLSEIINDGMFIKKYAQCGTNVQSFWIFILCDGEFGFFDGFEYRDYIPVSLAKLLGIDKILDSNECREVQIFNGNYELSSVVGMLHSDY